MQKMSIFRMICFSFDALLKMSCYQGEWDNAKVTETHTLLPTSDHSVRMRVILVGRAGMEQNLSGSQPTPAIPIS